MSRPKIWKNPFEVKPLVFKQWSNKGWSAFASLGKVVLIATLSFSYQMLAQEVVVERPDSSGARMSLELEEVETVALAPGELEELSLRPVILIIPRSISSSPAQSQDEILELLPQLDIRQRGKFGTQADLSILGGSFDQNMVLLNGIDLSDPQTGHFQLNLPLDYLLTDEVEVLTGSATRRFGPRAFTGAVNFQTRARDTSLLNLDLWSGAHRYYRGHLMANLDGRHVNALLGAGTSGSEGYRINTDFKNHHAFLQADAGIGPLKSSLMAGFNHRAFGANAFYSPRFPLQYEETSTGFAALKLDLGSGPGRWQMRSWLRMNRDHFLLDRNDPSFYQNDHLNRVLGAELEYRHSWPGGLTQTALRFKHEGILSTSLGEELEQGQTSRNAEVIFSHGSGRETLNWSLNHNWAGGPFALSGGFMLFIDPDNPDKSGIYPGIDLRYAPGGPWSVYGSVNRSMRLPTFTDLYYSDPANQGTAGLKSESALSYESGLSFTRELWQAGITAFYRAGRDMIDWVYLEDERWHSRNVGRVDALGSDLFLQYSALSAGQELQLEHAGIRYTFIHMEKAEGGYTSRYLLDHLRHKLVADAHLSMARFSLGLVLRIQDRNGDYLLYDADTGNTTRTPYEPFMLFDMKAAYDFSCLSLYVEAHNLFNTSYVDIGNIPQPGTWIMAGLRFSLPGGIQTGKAGR